MIGFGEAGSTRLPHVHSKLHPLSGHVLHGSSALSFASFCRYRRNGRLHRHASWESFEDLPLRVMVGDFVFLNSRDHLQAEDAKCQWRTQVL